ncbi:MAG: T9SS type A sorting domain-containing protein [Bacteroidales bacterium]|nr:T9SS type A sorting domain-containing protein [Bacteroidales bacterium]
MKRKSFLTVCFLLLCSLVYGQWTDPASTQFNMNAFVCVSVCGEEQNRADFEIAAFYGDKVRGVTKKGYTLPINGKEYMVYFMTIGGDNPYEEITFKLYDPVTGRVYHSLDGDSEPFYFIANSVAGDITAGLDPIALDFYHWNYEYDNTWDQTMTIYSTVYIDGNLQEREDIEIVAMCNGKVRSVSHPIRQGDKYILYLYISGNANDYNKDVTFMLYDHYANEGIELLSDDVTTFVGNNFLGTFEDPFVINFRTPYVARIGDVKYETLQEAVDAYNAGEIVILKNAQSDDTTTIGKNVTIDFAGFTYDGTLDLDATLNVVGTAGTATSMVLNEGAQVYHSYALETTIVRNVEGTEDVWGTLSAPTTEAVVVFNTEGGHDFYQYVESADLEWEFIAPETNAYQMRVGRGYLYANKEDVEMSFEGTLNMNAVEYALNYTEGKTLAGFNMIGNPYTHNINLNHLQGEIANAFYSVATDGAWVANVESPVIAPFQAVLVQTNAANNTVTINKTENNTEATARNASEGILKINVANNSYNDVAYVLFEEGIGLRKIGHFNEEIPMVSVSVEDKEYAVATMSKDVTEIPVSFKAMTMGQYTISVEAKDCEFDAMYLTDKFTGEKVNLNTGSYTFMATSNDNTDRFVLTMTTNTTGIEQNAECFVYVSNEEIRFNNINGQVNVRIYDMLGRPVAEYDVYESATISTSSFERGMYILQMTDENGVRTQKVLVD